MTSIFLVGNPNSGKSTIFNRLTGSYAHTGNWSGVTVSAQTKKLKNHSIPLTDLAGIYSLDPVSLDEENSVKTILNNKNALFLNVIDINSLQKSLRLTLNLIRMGLNIVVLLNLSTRAKSRGLTVDKEKLSALLGVPVLLDTANTNSLISSLIDYTKQTTSATAKPLLPPHALDKKAEEIAKLVTLATPKTPYAYSRLDCLLLNKGFGLGIFFLLMLFIFWLTFGPVGSFLSDSVELGCEAFGSFANKVFNAIGAPTWVSGFFSDVVILGVGGVLAFLPQIVILFFCLEFLEQSGYIARLVYLLEPFFAKLGLSGRSAFSLLLGFGCTTLALPSTDTINSKYSRIKTALILPFLPCNAKLPVIGALVGAFFANSFLVVFVLYALGIIVSLAFAWGLNKLYPTPQKAEIIEFTPLVFPSFSALVRSILITTLRFIKKIWGIILLFSIIIWFLSNFTFSLTPTNDIKSSILASFASFVAPLFTPLGFGWGIVIALIVGIIAKEMVLSTLTILASSSSLAVCLFDPTSIIYLDPVSAFAFLVFFVLYTPCISALASLKTSVGKKIFWFFLIGQFVLAFMISLNVSLSLKLIITGNIASLVISFALTIFIIALFLLIFTKNKCKNCISNCKFCK